jgi:hypothetical protein
MAGKPFGWYARGTAFHPKGDHVGEPPDTRPSVILPPGCELLALTIEEAGRVNHMLQHLVPDEHVRDEDWAVVSRINHWCRENPDL